MKRKPRKFSCLGFIVVILACVGIALVASSISNLSSPGVPPTATPKKGLSTILKVSPIGTEPATQVPVKAQAVPLVIETAVPAQPLPTVIPSEQVAPATGQGGYVCPNGEACVKGNINSDDVKLYHLPVGCPSYKATVIKTEDGERMFTSEAEAIEAGWKKSSNCK